MPSSCPRCLRRLSKHPTFSPSPSGKPQTCIAYESCYTNACKSALDAPKCNKRGFSRWRRPNNAPIPSSVWKRHVNICSAAFGAGTAGCSTATSSAATPPGAPGRWGPCPSFFSGDVNHDEHHIMLWTTDLFIVSLHVLSLTDCLSPATPAPPSTSPPPPSPAPASAAGTPPA